MTGPAHLYSITEDLPDYPLGEEDRLDSHFFVPWERRRWLNSDMRLKGSPECRAHYFDLICISYDQSPIGTLPTDLDLLARLVMTDAGHFRALTRMEYGPLHKWRPYQCGDEVRLGHPVIVRNIREAVARKADNRARTEAGNTAKRLQRLRMSVAGYHVELSKNDAAIKWMDEWLTEKGCNYRGGKWIEDAILAWSDHALNLGLRGRAQ